MPAYIIPVTCDLGKTLPSVGEMVDSVNSTMKDFGFDEKMCIRSQIMTVTLETERELTEQEKFQIQGMLQASYDEKLPEKDFQVASPSEWG